MNKLRTAKYLTSLDVQSACWQVEVEEQFRDKTSFTVPGRGLYRFKRMPFGLTNAPATWQRLVDRLTFEKHQEVLEKIVERLQKVGLTLSQEKCKFCHSELKYLGHVVDLKGLHVDPAKVSAILNVSIPKNTTEVRRIIGMASWYKRFIPHFSTAIAPLLLR